MILILTGFTFSISISTKGVDWVVMKHFEFLQSTKGGGGDIGWQGHHWENGGDAGNWLYYEAETET